MWLQMGLQCARSSIRAAARALIWHPRSQTVIRARWLATTASALMCGLSAYASSPFTWDSSRSSRCAHEFAHAIARCAALVKLRMLTLQMSILPPRLSRRTQSWTGALGGSWMLSAMADLRSPLSFLFTRTRASNSHVHSATFSTACSFSSRVDALTSLRWQGPSGSLCTCLKAVRALPSSVSAAATRAVPPR